MDDTRDVEFEALFFFLLLLVLVDEAEHRDLLSLLAAGEWLAPGLQKMNGLA